MISPQSSDTPLLFALLDVKLATRKAGFRGNRAAQPTKICTTCGGGMSRRKRRAETWAEVKYCSDACRRRRN